MPLSSRTCSAPGQAFQAGPAGTATASGGRMNNPPATCVLPDMGIHRQNGRPDAPAGRQDHTTDTRAQRHRWWPRRRRDRERALSAPTAGTDSVRTKAGALQLAIGLLTASLDSPELEAWAVWALIPEDPAALGDLLAGLHAVSLLLLHELQDATGQPPLAKLQELAILAETLRGTPSAG